MNAAEFPVKKHTISYYGTCKDCGWAIIFACCNDGFLDNMHKVHQHWDWWVTLWMSWFGNGEHIPGTDTT